MTTKQFKNVITKQLSMMYNYHFEKNGIKKASTKSFKENIERASESVYEYFKDIIKVSKINHLNISLGKFNECGENFYECDAQISFHYDNYKFIRTHCYTCISNWG